MNAAGPDGRKPWRLWHLAAVVVLAAPVFGAIRAMAVGPDGPAGLALVALVTVSACVAVSAAILRAGRDVIGRATSGPRRWGAHRDGLDGFLGRLVVFGIEFGFVLAATVIGSSAVVFLLTRLARLAGR